MNKILKILWWISNIFKFMNTKTYFSYFLFIDFYLLNLWMSHSLFDKIFTYIWSHNKKNVKTSAVNHSSKFEYSLVDLFYFRNISVWKCSQWKIRLLWHSFRKNECVIVPLNKMKLNVMTMNHEQDSMCIWR